MGAVGAELLAPQPPSGCITADLDGRAIPRFQVCLIASKRMLEFTRQVSFAQTSGGGGQECGVEGGRDSYRDHRGDGQRSSAL